MSEPPRLSPAQFWHSYQRYPYLLAKAALFALVAFAIYWALTNVQSVLFPILVSVLVAYLLDPTVDWFEAKGLNRTATIGLLMLIGLGGLALFVLVLYPAIATQVGRLIKGFPELVELVDTRFMPWLQEMGVDIPPDLSSAVATYSETIKGQLPSLAQKATKAFGEVVARTGAVVASILNLVMIPIFTFYFLRDFDRMVAVLADYVPMYRRELILDRVHMMDEVVGAWFRGQVQVAGILAVLYSMGLAAVFGFAEIGVLTGVAIGVMAGLLNIVPYFGFLIGFILSILMVLLEWNGFGPVIAVCVVFGIVQGLEGWIITPKVVGDKVGLSPVTVIIVLLLGGEIFGLMGVLLAIPVAGVIRVLIPDLTDIYQASPFYSGDFTHEEAVALAAGRSAESGTHPAEAAPSREGAPAGGLVEETDGTLDALDEPSDPSIETPPPADARRPVTSEHASVAERPGQQDSPLDVGTDGDPTDEDDESAAEEE